MTPANPLLPPGPVPDKQPLQPLDLGGEGHSVCGSHRMEVMYFSGACISQLRAAPIVWLMKGFSPPRLEGSWSVCTKAFASVAFEKRMCVLVQTELSCVLGRGGPSACQKGAGLSLVQKGEEFHGSGPSATAPHSLPLSQRQLLSVARLASPAVSH